MFKLPIEQFFAPNDSSTPAPSMGKEDVIEFLNDETNDEAIDLKPEKKADEKPDDEKEVEAKPDETKEEDEIKEIEEDLEEPDEEKLELTTPVSRREILKAYPDLFKKFPYLEKAYYREQQFTNLYPTIDEAREAKDKANVLQSLESDVVNGNLENILLASVSAKSFEKTIDNLLPAIYKVNEKAYLHLAGNIIKHTIASMVKEARRINNDKLQEAALVLNQFSFQSDEYTPPTRLAKDEPKNDENEKLSRERQSFDQQRFETANEGIETSVNNTVRTTITRYIDPKESMSEYIRDTAVDKCYDDVVEQLESDKRFSSVIDKLWENARKSNYSKDSLEKIRGAFLSKARTLLPSAIKKARNSALKGMGKRVVEEKEEETTTSSRKNSSPKLESRSHSIKDGPREGESSYDFLMRD